MSTPPFSSAKAAMTTAAVASTAMAATPPLLLAAAQVTRLDEYAKQDMRTARVAIEEQQARRAGASRVGPAALAAHVAAAAGNVQRQDVYQRMVGRVQTCLPPMALPTNKSLSKFSCRKLRELSCNTNLILGVLDGVRRHAHPRGDGVQGDGRQEQLRLVNQAVRELPEPKQSHTPEESQPAEGSVVRGHGGLGHLRSGVRVARLRSVLVPQRTPASTLRVVTREGCAQACERDAAAAEVGGRRADPVTEMVTSLTEEVK
eukprot:scaffold842_cov357-Prasinococcus_capsulatus_cf.AAC.5